MAYYHPDCGGGSQEVVRQLSERLAGRGHEVTVATTFSPHRRVFEHSGVTIRHFNIHGVLNHSALGIRGDVGDYLEYLREGRYDLVMNYAAQTWCTDLTCRLLPEIRARKILAACGYSGLIGARRLVYWPYFLRLPHYLRQYDTIVYHSENYIDKKFGDAHGITNYQVIPNGADSVEFQRPVLDFRDVYDIRTKYMLLTVGNHFKNKGHDRVIEAFRILKREDVTLVIIGKNSAPRFRSCWKKCLLEASRSGDNIRVVDNALRSHVVAAYFASDLFLSGSRIEAFPLVIVEAMASGTPFIAFPAGNIFEMPGGILVRSVDEMAAEIGKLLEDEEKRRELGKLGLSEQRARYDWEVIVNQYARLYQELLRSDRMIPELV
ncbi:MAG: glycosyltransferase family 4 protein [Deltaproteobacteria bacterium]|nr:glycosyltransferase family 4 protein [Deltaproteobacteria bacterium]